MLVLLALVTPAPAVAAPEDVACVGVSRPDCTITTDTLEDALATQAHLVQLGPGPFTGDFATTAPVELAGTDGTVIRAEPALSLGDAAAIHNVRIEGRLETVGNLTLDDVDLGRLVATGVEVTGRGVTITGDAALDGGSLQLSSSLVG